MFVLTRKAVAEFHPERAGEFVRYWSRFYQYDVKLLGKPGKRIIYDDELKYF